ncbi:transposase family protein [Actinoplanes awajinensis]|uniref:Transposase n=1 Tax=Actinoplanes awajinensis subsp. mycoplanecinus TaxID=135947 RepID=A0A0X3V423_9ACTN|nr:transposase family protein [Actinoplanes awajinensis]KUL39428.1 transposase [Actinoplanes awajinensis subsp. mycoplanecinus]
MLSYPATITLSSRTLNHLAERIRTHRQQRGSRWRRLNPGRQALLALAHLRNGDPYTRLAAGFEIGVATAWRYVQEAIALLSAAAANLAGAMRRIQQLAYAILDGTLISIDRVADQKPYYSGKHKRHGVNVQVIADAAGRLVWASPALPGSIHDLTAARTHGIIDALTSADVMTFADKGYQGARGSVRTPFKRRRFRPKLSRRQKTVNRAHAKIRAPGERAIATLKTWKILSKLRCCPRRATAIVQAILVLHHVEANRYAR